MGIHWAFAPMVDIARDPRWGRMIEGAGEDPFLGAAVAAAQVRGFQGEGIGAPERVIAGPKHFAGYGAALGGRDYDEVNLSDSELWNVYLPPFAAAVAAGAGNVMTAYMPLNGVPATGNRWLFTDVLRGALGFEGFVVSDANAVRNLVTHGFAADLTDAGARAVNAGRRHGDGDRRPRLQPPARGGRGGRRERGDARRARAAACWRRSCAWGCSTTRTSTRSAPARCSPTRRTATWPASRPSARRCCCATRATCCRSTPRAPGSIAVIGPLADSKRDTLGPWCFDFDLDETVTVLDGIRRKAGEAARVEYAPGVRPGAARLPVDVRHVPRQRARGPRGVRRRGRAAARGRPRPGRRRRRGRGRRVAEHDRRGRVALLAGAARPPARAAAGGRGDRHAGRAARA